MTSDSRVWLFKEYGPAGSEYVTTRERPAPQAGEVAVEVRASGVNPADWKIREGWMGTDTPTPRPLGMDVAGVVTDVGEGVIDFRVGDAVLGQATRGQGAWANHTVLEASQTARKPENMSWQVAGGIPVAGKAAWNSLIDSGLEAGQSMVVLGAGGGVGLTLIQVAVDRGIKVYGVASASKREAIETAGGTWIESGDGALGRLQDATGRADVLIDLVGGDPLRAIASISDRIVTASDRVTVGELGGVALIHHPESIHEITKKFADGTVKLPITQTFPFEEADRALAAVEEGHSLGKIVIINNDDINRGDA